MVISGNLRCWYIHAHSEKKNSYAEAGDIIRAHKRIHTFENDSDEDVKFVVFRYIPSGKDKRNIILHTLYRLKQNEIRLPVLKLAVDHTAKKRGSADDLADWKEIIQDIRQEPALTHLWQNYIANNPYAAGTTFAEVVDTVEDVEKALDSI